MADGITQPGGANTTIFLQDDTHADADLDGVLDKYHLSDIVAKGLASGDAIDLGTPTTKYFRSRATIQNGDGVGTAVTTFELTECCVQFDAARIYTVSTVGQANRFTRWGVLVQGPTGKPSGARGVRADFGAATTIRGNMEFYGCHLRVASGLLALTPNAEGLVGKIINTILETAAGAGNIVLGSGNGAIQRMYNVDIVLGGTGVVTNIFCDDIERITVAIRGTSNYFIQTASAFVVRDGVFIGTPGVADIRYTGPLGILINHTWSGNADKCEISSGIQEWNTFDVLVLDGNTNAPLPNIPVQLRKADGTTLFTVYTNASGRIVYNTDSLGRSAFNNVVHVATITRSAGQPLVETQMGPFTMRVNLDGTADPNYIGTVRTFSWPYDDMGSGFGFQYSRVWNTVVHLESPDGPGASGKEEWRSALA